MNKKAGIRKRIILKSFFFEHKWESYTEKSMFNTLSELKIVCQ